MTNRPRPYAATNGVEGVSLDRRKDMVEAADRVEECLRVLHKGGANVVSEVLKGQGEFYEWDHYPKGDVYDAETHAQYYYHSHPQEARESEHGHFHTFMRGPGIPQEVRPAPVADRGEPENRNDISCHLIGISMDRSGMPIRLFTTNRWVTGEVWYGAEDVIALLDRFEVDHAHPSWPTNIWLGAMIRLFRPEIEALIRARDRAVARWRTANPGADVHEDRALEITSARDIDLAKHIARVLNRAA